MHDKKHRKSSVFYDEVSEFNSGIEGSKNGNRGKNSSRSKEMGNSFFKEKDEEIENSKNKRENKEDDDGALDEDSEEKRERKEREKSRKRN